MSELRISEAGTVQFPMVRHAAEIGWTPLAPEVAKQKRCGEAGMLLRDELEVKLAEFNPWLTSDAIRAIVETLDAVPPTIEGNREMLAWLRGEKAWHDEAEKRHRRVTVIDFERTDSNVFHVSWEWMLKPPARKGNRADVMFLINARLREIGEYLDCGGFFPNSILINFRNDVRFDKQMSFEDRQITFCQLYLPDRFKSAWIIDGQHRLFGFTEATDESTHKIVPVLAFERLSNTGRGGIIRDHQQ